ncbi:putative glutamyl endopeptidase, chloroplastic isoform X1 [Senna tora]|uniref:Probable glutamyl endopeptidase, chloroplastic n=1 Tax=Senna tora TaxID=362788 RepID=A0A834W404_9FABA|nr:putative glutamyl endopeptidase, chloroplastic isoform X1 [Senna tora]
MMRLHKVYQRLSLLHFLPISLPSNPSLLPLSPPYRRITTNFTSITSMGASRFGTIAPLSAMLTEDGGGGNSNASVSSFTTTVDYEEDSNMGVVYRVPPPEIKDIVDAPPVPALSFSPHRDKILFLKRRSLPPLAELARPEEKLAGIRIDGNCNTRSRMSFYTGIGIHRILSDGTLGPEIEVHGFPDGAKINFVSWSPNGQHLSFGIRLNEENNESSKVRIWIADVETGNARPLFQSPDIYLNAVFDNYVWVDNSNLLVCTIPLSRGAPPKKPLVPSGPKIQSNEAKNIIQVRTFQDLLKDEYDEVLFDYYATSQLILASLDDQKYLLISSIHRPYSFIVPCGRFPKKVELWSADGKFVRELCDLPLAEDIPIASNSVRKGMRTINWRADKPSMLYWVETQDGGDAKVEVSPRDIIYTQPAETLEGEQPVILHKLDLRYGRTRTWVISPGSKDVSPRILFDRSSEDVYSDPGSPMLRRTQAGTYVIAKVKKGSDEGRYFLLNGIGATPEGNIPFLDLFEINTGNKERIWESDKEKYYETVVALMSDQEEGDLHLDQLKILTSKESKTENTQYFIVTWPDKKAYQITNFPHPYPQLASLQKEMIRYQRKDGVQLTATLYLPPGYNPSADGPLPCLVWSYPGEFKSKDAAGQVRGSPNEFPGIGPTSALLWLARSCVNFEMAGFFFDYFKSCRFAILSGPTIPIIGEGDEEANDRYVEQLVASAEAAVEEVVQRGVAHPKKIAVGGHSYGAFMTANLLAHAPHLFCCGIARSGAYNRTLTPFGFQNEDRTLWEATNTYVEMSPFMSANKIKKPILLIHGEEDNNSGTLTMQSDRFFNALKGHGALCRLVVLPYESHGYAARESIMHVLWETDRWLHKYCVSNTSDEGEDHDTGTVKENENVGKETKDSESKVVSASGGGCTEASLKYEGHHAMPRSSLW